MEYMSRDDMLKYFHITTIEQSSKYIELNGAFLNFIPDAVLLTPIKRSKNGV